MRVQSRYRRTLADLSAQGVPLRHARLCSPDLSRAPFAVPYARRTTRLWS